MEAMENTTNMWYDCFKAKCLQFFCLEIMKLNWLPFSIDNLLSDVYIFYEKLFKQTTHKPQPNLEQSFLLPYVIKIFFIFVQHTLICVSDVKGYEDEEKIWWHHNILQQYTFRSLNLFNLSMYSKGGWQKAHVGLCKTEKSWLKQNTKTHIAKERIATCGKNTNISISVNFN